MQKRALPSTSSGQPTEPKGLCHAPANHLWNGSEGNLELERCLTVEDVRRVVREELKCAKPPLADCCQSCAGNGLEDIKKQMLRMEDFLREAAELVNIISPQVASKRQKKDQVRNFKLQFRARLSLPLFTGQKIEGEHGGPIFVVLINATTGDIVRSGPESSIKLDVVVVEGGFKRKDEDNWTREEFERDIVKERDGKRPLLTGNLEVILKGGTGVLGELEFTDNASWTRSKKFRIGLQVSPGYCENIGICEAITEAFTVKEQRGDLNKKHEPPASNDDVWRLKKIAKDGPFHKRLNEAGIYKVEEFLRQFFMDAEKLKIILGDGMTGKNWKVLLDHAKTCTLNGKLYVYYHNNQSDHGVIFNNVGQLSGLIADGRCYATDRFSHQQKDYAERLVKKAYENWNDVRQLDAEASSSSTSEKISCPFLSEVLGDEQFCHQVHDNMPPPRLASQVGLQVPPGSSAFPVEGNSGFTSARLTIQSQNSQNATWNQTSDGFLLMEPSVDTTVQPFEQLCWSTSSYLDFNTEDHEINGLP